MRRTRSTKAVSNLYCNKCNKLVKPPIYRCPKKHIQCGECIWTNITCYVCDDMNWINDAEANCKYKDSAIVNCKACGLESCARDILIHQDNCPYRMSICCPLEDPYCDYDAVFDGISELKHMLNVHVHKGKKTKFMNRSKCLDNLTVENDDEDECGNKIYRPPPDNETALSLAHIADVTEFTMYCSKIGYPGYYRHSILVTLCDHGFLCSLQRYERCQGLTRFRVAVIFLGPLREELNYEAEATFQCNAYTAKSKLRVLSVIENMHRIGLGNEECELKPVLEIKEGNLILENVDQHAFVIFKIIKLSKPRNPIKIEIEDADKIPVLI